MPNNETINRYQVQSVARAMEILELVASSGENGLSLTEIAQAVGMAKSSTIAAARTLAQFGLLQIDGPGPRYRLGLALLRYGDLVAQQTTLGKSALPLLHELTEATGLTARLAMNDNGFPVFVERVDGKGSVRFHTPLGQRESPHATSAGKVILAQLDEDHVRKVIDEVGLDAIEIVLGLRVDHPEHGIGVGMPVHMRDSPIIAHDGNVACFFCPTRLLRS